MPIITPSPQTLAPVECQPLCRPPIVPIVDCCTKDLNLGRDVAFECLDSFIASLKSFGTYKEGADRLAAPDNALSEFVREALQDFTRHSMVLRRRATMKTVKGQATYYITPLDNEQIHRIQSICVGRFCIPFKDGVCCDAICPTVHMGKMQSFSFEIPNKIIFNSAECVEDQDITIKYVAESTHDACMVDKQILARYKDAIVHGAAARLLMQPMWEWTNPKYGQFAQGKYDKLLTEAKIDMARRFSLHGQQAAKPRGRL
jgi:hypothetical protein